MNVLFHIAAAIGVAVSLTDIKSIEGATSSKNIIVASFFAFIAGIIVHGVLDYIPHCYPINSKFDAVAGLTMILTLIWLTNKKYRLIVGLSFVGSIFPDLIDLSPGILNKQFGLNLPIFKKVFPWHLHDYSGSIYTNNCDYSTLNHIVLLLTIGIICWSRQANMKTLFGKTRGKRHNELPK